MRFIETSLAGVTVIDPTPHLDDRGRFIRAWCAREFADHGTHFAPVQANMGFNPRKATLRGLHLQISPAPEAKLVRCTRGSAFDVVVDLRPDSPTYTKWFATQLSAENGRMIFIPEQCAHGYQTLEDNTEMHYMTSAYYAPDCARGARFDDPTFGIEWPLTPTMISAQDQAWPLMQLQGNEDRAIHP